mmetsp:Transcript_29483/g.83089  ORF Transcript_29483/g.83089 Transcript_29483/m.83089 type:complete len:192 (-) Transcript_29483:118-693(-)
MMALASASLRAMPTAAPALCRLLPQAPRRAAAAFPRLPAAPAAVAGGRSMSTTPTGGGGAGEEGVRRALARLLSVVSEGDWAQYERLCDPGITCFEPETVGHVAKGLPFHRFYFDLPGGTPPAVKPNVTLADVHVRMLAGGDAAVVCYVRLVQALGAGGPETLKSNETRVFERAASAGGEWVCVHFHRSPA